MSLVPALVYALARVGAAFSIIVLSCRFAHKRLASRQTILGKLGDHSYAIYCLHLPIVVGVQYLLLPVSMPILLKCTLSLVLPVVVSFVLAAKLVRPHPRWAVVLLLSFFLGAAIVF